MPRNMSFMLTTEQAMNKTKTVTRRTGWGFLRPGDIVQQVEQAQGLQKGETVRRLHMIRIVDIRLERLESLFLFPEYGRAEMKKEGFPGMPPRVFIEMLCRHNRLKRGAAEIVRRIEFEYIEGGKNIA